MDENVGTLLAQVSRLMRRSFDARAREIGVTRPQWQVISLLRLRPGCNQGALAEMLEVEPITVGRMIDRLQDSALVERRADPADRRAWRLHLTAKGEGLLESLMPHAAETIDEAMEGMTGTDRQQFISMLVRMRSNLSRRSAAGLHMEGQAVNG
jgi:DNA-binding MarR family transcriptional regulator